MKYCVILLAALLTACGNPGPPTVAKYSKDVQRAVNGWQPSLGPAWTAGTINAHVYDRLNVIANHQKAAARETAELAEYATASLTLEERQQLREVLQPLLEEFSAIGLLIALEHQP